MSLDGGWGINGEVMEIAQAEISDPPKKNKAILKSNRCLYLIICDSGLNAAIIIGLITIKII